MNDAQALEGEIGILNVGAGHDKIKFDPSDSQSMKRASKIVQDMLKLGYAILIETSDDQGGTTTKRVKRFDSNTYEYIIGEKLLKGRKVREKRVSVTRSRGTAVARTSGG